MIKEPDMTPEEAALKGLLSADEYLDLFGEPRRPWPEVIDHGVAYCARCQQFFARRDAHRKHMREVHMVVVPSRKRLPA